MKISINLTEEEKDLAERYARLHDISVGEAFKSALFEKIEEEYDFMVAKETYQKYVSSGFPAEPLSDFLNALTEL